MLDHATTTRPNVKMASVLRALVLCGTLAAGVLVSLPVRAEITVEMAGVSAAVTGNVTMTRSTGEIGVVVESGMPVYLGDRIRTSANSGMQILLLDETVFTVGPDSDIAIDEFVYDPATGEGRIVADMVRGVMRFVTGKIPLNNPASMDINLPVGSIGIRGTIGLVRSVSAQQANEIVPGTFDTSSPDAANRQIFMAVNQGPGLSRNDTTSRPGAFAVADQTGNSENITGENFGVFVSEDVVTTPTRFPQGIATFDFSTSLVRTASRTTDDTNGGTSQSPATGETQSSLTPGQTRQASVQTGATMAGSLEVAMAQVGSTRAGFDQDQAAPILGNIDSVNNNNSSISSSDSSTDPFTFDGLREIASGTVSTGAINIDGANVDYSFSSSIDFANREMRIVFSNVQVNDLGPIGSAGFLDGAFNPTTFDYSGSSGNVEFGSGDFSYDPNCTALGCSATATFKDAYNVDFNLSTTGYPTGTDGNATLN